MPDSVTPAPLSAFTPGHLGELTALVPPELVDDVLERSGRLQQRVRRLPARVLVYLLLAGALFAGQGWRQVWARLVAGLAPDSVLGRSPSRSGIAQGLRRLGSAPLRDLFDILRGPAATTSDATRWRGLLLVAVDGTILTVADSPANLTRFVKQNGGPNGPGSYPTARLCALVACGTRTLIDAVFDAASVSEIELSRTLVRSLRPGMLLLADRLYPSATTVALVADSGADLLMRAKIGPKSAKLPVLRRLDDGTWISRLGTTPVRVITATIRSRTSAGTTASQYKLITTLLDPDHAPARELLQIYHERWEIETAYLELKSSMLGHAVLRARTPDGVTQEIYALLSAYQLLRTAMSDAILATPHLDPDRASFTIALLAARDQITAAATAIENATENNAIDLVGRIGAAIHADLLPPRRARSNARVVKRALSKYAAREKNTDRRTYSVQITIEMTPLTDQPPP